MDVREKAKALRCAIPDGIVLLPSSFEGAKNANELIYADSVDTVKKLLVQAGISVSKIEQDGQQYPRTVYHALEWIGPIILIPAAAYSQNPEIVTMTLNVLSNYLTEWFRGVPKENRKATIRFVKETKDGDFKMLDFSGPPECLEGVKELVEKLDDEKTS